MSILEDDIDWSLTTWEGSRRAALRDWMALSLTEKWQAVEEMADFARATVTWRRKQGLPYIDPYTGERVPGSVVIREDAPPSLRSTQAIPLSGCNSEPLISYLKALGVLRLVSEDREHGDPKVRGAWKDGAFVLYSKLSREELVDFFLTHYAPSPILAPWGARSGFFAASAAKKTDSERKAREALDAICKQTADRFTRFKHAVAEVHELLKELKLTEKAKDEEKLALLAECRARLPDEMLCWLDTCYVLTADE